MYRKGGMFFPFILRKYEKGEFGSLKVWSDTFLPLDNGEDTPKGRGSNLVSPSADPRVPLPLFCLAREWVLSLQAAGTSVLCQLAYSLVCLKGGPVGTMSWPETEARRPLTPPSCLSEQSSHQLHPFCNSSWACQGPSVCRGTLLPLWPCHPSAGWCLLLLTLG